MDESPLTFGDKCFLVVVLCIGLLSGVHSSRIFSKVLAAFPLLYIAGTIYLALLWSRAVHRHQCWKAATFRRWNDLPPELRQIIIRQHLHDVMSEAKDAYPLKRDTTTPRKLKRSRRTQHLASVSHLFGRDACLPVRQAAATLEREAADHKMAARTLHNNAVIHERLHAYHVCRVMWWDLNVTLAGIDRVVKVRLRAPPSRATRLARRNQRVV